MQPGLRLWRCSVQRGPPNPDPNGGAAELSFAWDKTTGHNGDKLHLTVTRIKAGSLLGASEFGIASKVNGADVGMSWSLAD
jgi:hypothetical protein